MALTELFAKSLLSAHAFIAGTTGAEIWRLDAEKGEHTEIARAVTNVLRHYDVPGVSEKSADWIMLAQTLGMAYGTRIFAARMMAKSSPPRAANAPQVVVNNDRAPQNAAPKVIAEPDPGPSPGVDYVLANPGPGLPKQWVLRQ